MENKNELSFHGNGSKYFGIIIVNMLLMIITLGLYYPWAKSDKLKYLYGEAEFNGSRFAFHGTGKEIFKGFLKLMVFMILIYGIIIAFTFMGKPMLGVLIAYLGIFAIVPLAIHGSLKYRMSRTSWRGIHFGYRGDLKELNKLFFKNLLLTIIKFGIYGSWMAMKLRNYTLSNVRFGNVKIRREAAGSEYFFMNLRGYLLSIITLGIYSFWWINESFEFYVDHLSIDQNEKSTKLKATTTGGGFFKVMVSNFFLVAFTLGFASAWAELRLYRYIFANIKFEGSLDADAIIQTEEDYKDASGDDASDFFDIGII